MLVYVKSSEIVLYPAEGPKRVPLSLDVFHYQEIVDRGKFVEILKTNFTNTKEEYNILLEASLAYIGDTEVIPIEKSKQVSVIAKNKEKVTVNGELVSVFSEFSIKGVYSALVLPSNLRGEPKSVKETHRIISLLHKNKWANFINQSNNETPSGNPKSMKRIVLLLAIFILCLSVLFAVYFIPQSGIFKTTLPTTSPTPEMPTPVPTTISYIERSKLKIKISNASEIPGKAGAINNSLIESDFAQAETETATESAVSSSVQFSKNVSKDDKKASLEIIKNEGFKPSEASASANMVVDVLIILGKDEEN